MMRLLCCHLINSIFSRSKVKKYLPCYYQWLESNKIIFSHIFDFESFKRWIHAETENNLDKTITDLIKRFF